MNATRSDIKRLGLPILFVAIFFANTSLFAQEAKDGLEQRARNLLSDNCYDCHGHDEPEAGLDLEHFTTIESIRTSSEMWKKVLRRVADGSMPPDDSDSLTKEDREYFAKWVDHSLHDISCTENSNPGHVTIRRLNRLEYRNSIRDLLNVDYQPAESFPGDDTGYGFDNIGDVLSLPPVLMEKYLIAAEKISQQSIPAPEDYVPVDEPIDLAQWKKEGGVRTDYGPLSFYSNGSAEYKFPGGDTREVTVRIKAKGDQAGDEPVAMSIYLNKKKLKQIKIREDDQIETHELSFRISANKRTMRIAFENDYYDEDNPDPNQRDRNLIVEGVSIVKLEAATAKSPIEKNAFFFMYPDIKSDEISVAEKLTSVWASRFFRRPCSQGEVDRLMKIYADARDDGTSFEGGMQYVLQAILVSPKFLYKVERPAPSDGSTRDLTSFELATSLSYFLWSSTPDADLLKVSLQENLQNDEVLKREIRRLLKSEKTNQMVQDFAGQWLQLRTLSHIEPNPTAFPDTDRRLIDDMKRETELFCLAIMREDRSLLDFLNADFTFLNHRLARHYGLSEGSQDTRRSNDEDFSRVSLAGTARGGLLTQASILTVTSNPTRTSPVKRGKWILENLLGEPPPPALPDVMPLEQQELKGSLREQMEQHRRDPSCASCHDLMDPLGFALENFDGVGRWRDSDGGSVIDANGELPSGESFSGAAELRQVLIKAKQDEFIRCVTEKMMIYALGRGLRYEDQCAVNEITLRLQQNDYRFSELLYGVIESAPFRKRQLQMKD